MKNETNDFSAVKLDAEGSLGWKWQDLRQNGKMRNETKNRNGRFFLKSKPIVYNSKKKG